MPGRGFTALPAAFLAATFLAGAFLASAFLAAAFCTAGCWTTGFFFGGGIFSAGLRAVGFFFTPGLADLTRTDVFVAGLLATSLPLAPFFVADCGLTRPGAGVGFTAGFLGPGLLNVGRRGSGFLAVVPE